MEMTDIKKKVYFASDAHFGLSLVENPIDSQKRFCRWLDSIMDDCHSLYLVGDMFDYWFEYRTVVPKGFVRVLGKLAEFCDKGIPVYMFHGNHDLWMFGYLQKEVGVKVIPNNWVGDIFGKRFYITHGDGLGDPSFSFRILRSFFRNRVAQFFYGWIHPDVTMPFGSKWAYFNRSRKSKRDENGNVINNKASFLGEDKEYQIVWAKKYLQEHPDIDFFVFGHRHIELEMPVGQKSRLFILGEWIHLFTYGVFDGETFSLKNFVD